MCEYFCIGFIAFMFKGKTLAEFTNIFSPNNFENFQVFYEQCICIK